MEKNKKIRIAIEKNFIIIFLSQYFRHQKVDPTPYLEACKLDCCGGGDAVTCGCKSFEAYARACMDASPTLRDLSWRSDQICRK